jgi:gliding motility-associated-like protein
MNAQNNLVHNGDFEFKLSCNFSWGAISIAQPWVNANNGTSDYFNSCLGIGAVANVPINRLGYQNPHSGNGYAGCGLKAYNLIDSNHREYIQSSLTKELRMDAAYYVRFYINLADSPQFRTEIIAINSIGVYFSDTIIYKPILKKLDYEPQIESNLDNFYADTAEWMKIDGVYRAHGGEQFITLANFKNDSNTLEKSIAQSKQLPIELHIAYYYFDDVSVYEITEPRAINDTTICYGDSIVLGTNDSAIACRWFPALGLNDSTFTNPIASPTQTSWYFVTHANSFGYVARDSVLISVIDCRFESELQFPNIYTPNGDGINDVFSAKAKNIVSFSCKIYNRYGQQVAMLKEIDDIWDGLNASKVKLPDGVYYYQAKAMGKDEKVFDLRGAVSLIR